MSKTIAELRQKLSRAVRITSDKSLVSGILAHGPGGESSAREVVYRGLAGSPVGPAGTGRQVHGTREFHCYYSLNPCSGTDDSLINSEVQLLRLILFNACKQHDCSADVRMNFTRTSVASVIRRTLS